MSETAVQRFSCDGCGKRYPWKSELSNKRVKCKCGAVMTVPDLSVVDEGPPALPDDDIFDIVEQQREVAPPRYQAMEAAAAAALPVAAPAKPKASSRSGSNRTGSPVGYASGRQTPREKERDHAIHDLTRDVYVPLALICGAFAAYFLWLFIDGRGSGASIAIYGIGMAVIFAIKTVLMIAGAFVVASLGSVSFGPFWTACLKLAAVAVAPDILATIIEEAIGVPGAGILAWSVALLFYWILIAWLFSMDANEAWMVVVLFAVLRWFLTFIVSMFVLGMFFSGSMGRGLVSGGAPSASQAAIAFDEKVADWQDVNRLEEAEAYTKRTSRQSAMMDVTAKLYEAGAKNVWFAVDRDINGKAEPFQLVVEWPRDAKKRAAVLDVIQAFHRTHFGPTTQPADPNDVDPADPDFDDLYTPPTDEGGKYAKLPLLG